MNAEQLRILLDLWMSMDTTVLPEELRDSFDKMLEEECLEKGFDNIPDAYHRHVPA